MIYSTKKYTVLLLAAIFVVSFGFSLYYRIRPTVDAKAYDYIAWNLARGYGYVEDAHNSAMPAADDAIVRVGPGYEFFLAGIYSLFGHHVWMVWFLQALLRVGGAYVLFRIVLLLFNDQEEREAIALLAMALFGFTPDLIILNGMLLAETFFVTSLLCALYVSFRTLETKRISFMASVWWGIASLVRPTALALTVLYAAYAYITEKSVARAAAVFVVPIVLLGAWSLRNSLLYHTPLFTTTAGAYALWVGNNADATGGFDKTPEIQAVRDRYHSVELSKIAIRKYTEFIKKEPLQFVALQARKTSMYFSILRPSGFWFYLYEWPIDRLFTLLASSMMTGFLFVTGGAGMYMYASRREKHRWFLISAALLQPLTVIPLYIETRYRAPFFPFLAFFAAYALHIFLRSRKEKEHAPLLIRAFFFSGILIAIFTLGDGLYSYAIITERVRVLFSQLLLR